MYVVRLRSADSGFTLRAFTSKRLALSKFEAGQEGVIDEDLEEAALFDVASTDDPKTAIQLVRDGRAFLVHIYPRPMTEAQAVALLAHLAL